MCEAEENDKQFVGFERSIFLSLLSQNFPGYQTLLEISSKIKEISFHRNLIHSHAFEIGSSRSRHVITHLSFSPNLLTPYPPPPDPPLPCINPEYPISSHSHPSPFRLSYASSPWPGLADSPTARFSSTSSPSRSGTTGHPSLRRATDGDGDGTEMLEKMAVGSSCLVRRERRQHCCVEGEDGSGNIRGRGGREAKEQQQHLCRKKRADMGRDDLTAMDKEETLWRKWGEMIWLAGNGERGKWGDLCNLSARVTSCHVCRRRPFRIWPISN